jgi:hypothetical protein
MRVQASRNACFQVRKGNAGLQAINRALGERQRNVVADRFGQVERGVAFERGQMLERGVRVFDLDHVVVFAVQQMQRGEFGRACRQGGVAPRKREHTTHAAVVCARIFERQDRALRKPDQRGIRRQ